MPKEYIIMSYDRYLSDIDYALIALEESLLLKSVFKTDLICDVYIIPSHNHQAFYLQVYDSGKSFTLIYAKPYIIDSRGLECVMYPFLNAVESNKHPTHHGHIYCGIKKLPKSNLTITQLIECLPQEDEFADESSLHIDGVATILRNYCSHPPINLAYYDSNDISINNVTREQRFFLSNLYLYIERIIGNNIISKGMGALQVESEPLKESNCYD